MTIRADVPLKLGGDTTRCPTCGSPVRIVYRDGKHADHYEPIRDHKDLQQLAPVDAVTSEILRKQREGKKSVALVGFAPTSCSLAPYNEPGIEVWGLNEAHSFSWMKSWDRWFQLHPESDFTRDIDDHRAHERGYVKGHYDWLKQEHGKPIYMLYSYSQVPDCQTYPLEDVSQRFFKNILKGEERIKYFTSSFSYMLSLALYEGFERVEIYGFEMAGGDEYVPQKACAEFWLGVATGMDIEIYLPPKSQLLWGALYGYQGHGASNVV